MNRLKFYPVAGEIYKNRCGSDFKCLSVLSSDLSCAYFRNVRSNWICLGMFCYLYDNGEIEWEYSKFGHFE